MFRADHSTALEDANGAGKDGYTEGSPGTVPATVLTAEAMNSIQEEIASVIEGFGITLSKPSKVQLLAAINKIATLIADRLVVTSGMDITPALGGSGLTSTTSGSPAVVGTSAGVDGVRGVTLDAAASGVRGIGGLNGVLGIPGAGGNALYGDASAFAGAMGVKGIGGAGGVGANLQGGSNAAGAVITGGTTNSDGAQIEAKGTGNAVLLTVGTNGAHLKLIPTTDPASPVDGQIWYTGASLKMYIDGVGTVVIVS